MEVRRKARGADEGSSDGARTGDALRPDGLAQLQDRLELLDENSKPEQLVADINPLSPQFPIEGWRGGVGWGRGVRTSTRPSLTAGSMLLFHLRSGHGELTSMSDRRRAGARGGWGCATSWLGAG